MGLLKKSDRSEGFFYAKLQGFMAIVLCLARPTYVNLTTMHYEYWLVKLQTQSSLTGIDLSHPLIPPISQRPFDLKENMPFRSP